MWNQANIKVNVCLESGGLLSPFDGQIHISDTQQVLNFVRVVEQQEG